MSKYDPLGTFLRAQSKEHVPMRFADIIKVVGHPLPPSARYPAWWSNNETNNVMTKVWLDAGFRTEQVDIAGQKLIFRRQKPAGISEEKRDFKSPPARGNHPLLGALKGYIRTLSDLTKPADPDWGTQ
jgi:hypothetical protein